MIGMKVQAAKPKGKDRILSHGPGASRRQLHDLVLFIYPV